MIRVLRVIPEPAKFSKDAQWNTQNVVKMEIRMFSYDLSYFFMAALRIRRDAMVTKYEMGN